MCCGQTGLQQRLEESELQRGGKRGGKTKQIELESEQRHTESTGQLTTLQADLAARDNQLSELKSAASQAAIAHEQRVVELAAEAAQERANKEAMGMKVRLGCSCIRL